jgi:hypothetical protein
MEGEAGGLFVQIGKTPFCEPEGGWDSRWEPQPEQDCYQYCIRFEIAWAQKWAQSPFFVLFQDAVLCSKLLILFGSSGRTRIINQTYFQQYAGQRMTP